MSPRLGSPFIRFALAALWLTTAAAAATPAAAQPTRPRRVVVLYDERVDLPGLAVLDAQLTQTLTGEAGGATELYREVMDRSRFPAAHYPLLLRDFLRSKYAGKQIDVVIAVMGPALDFMLDQGRVAFPGAAIVFCGIERRELRERVLPPNVTGVLMKREFAPTLRLALRLQPDTRRVIYVAGSSPFDARLNEIAMTELGSGPVSVRVEFFIGRPLRELADTLSRLPPHTVVLYSTMFADRDGTPYVTHDAVQRIASVANAPVYVFLDQYMGRGVVGGHVYSIRAHGEYAARLALRILHGTLPSELPPIEPSASSDRFDSRQLGRWNIPASRLPAGSTILFAESPPWKRFRVAIAATVGVLVLQLGLIFLLLAERRTRRGTEVALRDSELRAERQAAEQRRELAHLGRVALVGELSGAIAHELNQPLAAILANARAAQRLLDREGGAARDIREILEDIAADDRRAGAVIHRVRHLVKRDVVDSQVLFVNEVVEEAMRLTSSDLLHRGVAATANLAMESPAVCADRVQLLQVVLNLVMNACDAMVDTPPRNRLLEIRTGACDRFARIDVRDQGCGIPPESLESIFEPFETTKKEGLGLGLAICRSITAEHGGELRASNNPGRGATFIVTLPLAHVPSAVTDLAVWSSERPSSDPTKQVPIRL
jgi:signal transduction histidine kinase